MITEAEMKDVVLKARKFLLAFEAIAESLTDEDKEILAKMTIGPVGLRDVNKFNLAIAMPTNAELQEANRNLAGAIAAENWREGLVFVLQIMILMGG